VHCHTGRDRTGIVIAALLFVLGIPNDIIQQEYKLCFGHRSGLLFVYNSTCKSRWLRGVDVKRIRQLFSVPTALPSMQKMLSLKLEAKYLKGRLQTLHKMLRGAFVEDKLQHALCRLLVDFCDAKLRVISERDTINQDSKSSKLNTQMISMKTWLKKAWALQQLCDFPSAITAYDMALSLLDSPFNDCATADVIDVRITLVEQQKSICKTQLQNKHICNSSDDSHGASAFSGFSQMESQDVIGTDRPVLHKSSLNAGCSRHTKALTILQEH